MSGSDKLERLTFLDDLVFIAKFIGFLLMMISLLLRWLYFDLELSGTIKDLLGVDYMECSANIIGKASAKNVVLESVSYKIELKIPLLRLIGSLIILLTLLLILETMWLLYSRQTAKGMKRIDKINIGIIKYRGVTVSVSFKLIDRYIDKIMGIIFHGI